jgi:hypothetical protein
MTDFVAEPIPIPIERSQTRTLIRRDDVFDEDDDDRDVVTVDREKDDRPKDFVDQIRSTPNIIERQKDHQHHHVDQTGLDEGSSESTAPSRATTDPASTLRDSGYSDITGGSRNFTPGLKKINLENIFFHHGKKETFFVNNFEDLKQ